MKPPGKYLVATGMLVLSANLLLMPVESSHEYVPPSKMFLEPSFAYRLFTYRTSTPADLVIAGNSRTGAGLDPDILAKDLDPAGGYRAHNLAVGGGFFPFYELLFTELLEDDLPPRVILGISPRDFNRLDPRHPEVARALQASTGYQLERSPYFPPTRVMEGFLTDLHATLLPGFFYRSQWAGEETLPPSRFTRPKWMPWNLWSALDQYDREFRQNVRIRLPGPVSRDGTTGRLGGYLGRFGALFGWRPPEGFLDLTRAGGSAVLLEPAEVSRARRERLDKEWAEYQRLRAPGERFGSECVGRAELDDGPDNGHDRLLDYFDEQGTDLVVVLLPAMVLEGCENSLAFNHAVKGLLRRLQLHHRSLSAVIDINGDFDHQYMRPDLYSDLEHLTPEGARLVSVDVAERLRALGWAP